MTRNLINLNNNANLYYETLDENFDQAIKLFEKNLSQYEILELLRNGNIAQKQIAALKIESLQSLEDALILTQNLVGQDGKIREAVSLKLFEFAQNPDFIEFITQPEIYDILLNAIIDVNSNVCRNIISTIAILKSYNDFCEYFCPKLVELTLNLVAKVKQFDFQDGKYKVNKEVFKLYWCLETIYELSDFINLINIKKILIQTQNIDEYTIREKTAKILSKNFVDSELILIRNKLKTDKNYYVRRF